MAVQPMKHEAEGPWSVALMACETRRGLVCVNSRVPRRDARAALGSWQRVRMSMNMRATCERRLQHIMLVPETMGTT